MKTLKSIFLLLVAFTWTVPAMGDDAPTVPSEMVEFCAATLYVVRDLPEYELWRETYEMDQNLINLYIDRLSEMIANSDIRGSELLDGANDCIKARKEEWVDD